MKKVIPIYVINKLLKSTTDREKLMGYIKYIDNYPSWLGGADKEVKVSTVHGFEMLCDRTDYIGRTVIETGEWEPLVSKTIATCLDKGDTAIDIGANIGYDSLLMSKAVGESGQVISFEPNPDNFFRLYTNISLNQMNNICVQSMALSHSLGWGNITIEGEYGHANLRNESSAKKTHKVMTVNLDNILSIPRGEKIKLIKMDIEGFEYNVLQGMKILLENVEYLICEVHDHFLRQCGSSAQELVSFMSDCGYTVYCADPESNEKWKKCDHTYKPKNEYSSGYFAFDALFCRETDPILGELIE